MVREACRVESTGLPQRVELIYEGRNGKEEEEHFFVFIIYSFYECIYSQLIPSSVLVCEWCNRRGCLQRRPYGEKSEINREWIELETDSGH